MLSAALALSCTETASTDMPEWRWTDKEPVEVPEPHPAITGLGWTNVSADYSTLPDGINVYRSPETIDGNKVIAYIGASTIRTYREQTTPSGPRPNSIRKRLPR